MKSTVFICLLISSVSLLGFKQKHQDYRVYHKKVNEVEVLLSEERFREAFNRYEELLKNYDFIFLRDYKVISQLALYLDEKNKALHYIRKGLRAGWQLKEIRQNDFLRPLYNSPEWQTVDKIYDQCRQEYLASINLACRQKVHLLYKKDQRKALGALLRIGQKAKVRYAENKFAPQSESHIRNLIKILEAEGYPGEKIIGNNFWVSTIISHHNSISPSYAIKDTLYRHIKPTLIDAVTIGEMSPYEFALVDDWQIATSLGRTISGYGFLIPPKKEMLLETNRLRQKIGLRSIELRNKLVEIQKNTGMDFYLPTWIDGKIKIEP